jgi:hypothetical protein
VCGALAIRKGGMRWELIKDPGGGDPVITCGGLAAGLTGLSYPW